MTTAQRMFALNAALIARTLLVCTVATLILGGCAGPRYVSPTTQLPAAPPEGAIWAVAPLRNESGASLADELALTDTLVAELSQAPGLVVLPVNRTIAGMRALGIPSVDTPAQARELARTLGATGIIVGSITAWNPYEPPVLGMSLALFDVAPSPDARGFGADEDPLALRGYATDGGTNARDQRERPAAVMSAVFDAADGNTRALIRAYAEGRHDPSSALGWKQYTASMALYAKFACFEASRRLLRSEPGRTSSSEARAETTTR